MDSVGVVISATLPSVVDALGLVLFDELGDGLADEVGQRLAGVGRDALQALVKAIFEGYL